MTAGLEKRDGVYADGRVDGMRLSELLGVPHGTVKRWLRDGLPCERRGHRVRIDESEARAWVGKRYPKSISFRRSDATVYFIRRDSDRAIKIGFTSDVVRRIHEIRRDTQSAVTLLACIPGAKPVELSIQARFAADVIRDEWFRPSKRLLAFIASLGRVAA